MTFKPRPYLLATSACLVLASAAHAGVVNTASGTTVTGTVTSTLDTGTITGPTVISGTGTSLNVTGARAIDVNSNFTPSNTFTIQTGATVGSTSQTIEFTNANAASSTINISGTLTTSMAGGKAISATGVTNALTIRSNGTISGSIYTGSGNDSLRLENASMHGDINLGNGTNTLTVSNTVVNGNFVGGTGSDTINISSGGLISGTITDATPNDSDTINFYTKAGVYNIVNNISGIENINVSNTLNINTGISGVQNFQINSGGIVNANSNFGLVSTGHLNVSGTLNIAAGHNVTADNVAFASGAGLGIAVSDSTHAGQLVTSGNITTGPAVTVNLGPTAGYIANGTSFTIIKETGAGTLASGTIANTANGLYSYQLGSTAGQSVSLTILRAATASLVQSSAGKAAANALDTLGAGSTGDLFTIQNNLNSATSAAAVNDLVQSLTPAAQTGAAIASVNVGTATAQNVDTRLASLRTGTTGMNTGDTTYSHNVWAQAFANNTDQDTHNGNPGFTATTGGGNLGVDTDALIDGLTTGLAVTYARSNVDGKGAGNDSTDIDTYLLSLYTSQLLGNGFFVNSQLGGGYNNYNTNRQVIGFASQTDGKYNGEQASAKLDGGVDMPLNSYMNGLIFTPLASVQYTYLNTGAYTETGPAALRIDSNAFNAIDVGGGAQLAWNYAMSQGFSLRPTLRARYIYRAGDTTVDTTSRFVAGGPAFSSGGVQLDRSSVDLGAGLLLTSIGGTNISIDYDADVRPSLIGHTGQLKVKMPF